MPSAKPRRPTPSYPTCPESLLSMREAGCSKARLAPNRRGRGSGSQVAAHALAAPERLSAGGVEVSPEEKPAASGAEGGRRCPGGGGRRLGRAAGPAGRPGRGGSWRGERLWKGNEAAERRWGPGSTGNMAAPEGGRAAVGQALSARRSPSGSPHAGG